jgi:hypothetical protein
MSERHDPSEQITVTHRGGCHCGAVRFEVDAPADLDVLECNCSRCRMLGFLHLIVPASRFRLVAGEDALRTYTFNTGVAKHRFCERCAVQSFYVPRSNPDGFSINARCLEPATVRSMRLTPFDGAHWEASAADLAHLSRE